MAVQNVNKLRARLNKQVEMRNAGMAAPPGGGVRAPSGTAQIGGFGAALNANAETGGIRAPMATKTGGNRFADAGRGFATALGQDREQAQPAAQSRPKDPTTNVSDIAAEIMGRDSRLLQMARTRGAQKANSRGLLNSSISAGESERAMLEQVVPMASQESQQRFNRQQANRDTSNRMREAKQGFGFSRALSNQKYQQDRKLSDQEFRQNKGLSAQDFRQKLGMSRQDYRENLSLQKDTQNFTRKLSALEYEQSKGLLYADTKSKIRLSQKDFEEARKLSGQEFEQMTGLSRQEYRQELAMQERRLGTEKYLAGLDSNTRKTLMSMERDMREELAKIDVGATEKQNMTSMLTSMHEMYQNSMRSILSNTALPADERTDLLKSSGELLKLQTELVKDVYAVDFKWATNFDITTPTPPPPTDDTAPTPPVTPPQRPDHGR